MFVNRDLINILVPVACIICQKHLCYCHGKCHVIGYLKDIKQNILKTFFKKNKSNLNCLMIFLETITS